MCHRNANLLQSFCRGEVSCGGALSGMKGRHTRISRNQFIHPRHVLGIKAPSCGQSAVGKEPYVWFRLYGPEDAFWNKTFKMPDVELVQ